MQLSQLPTKIAVAFANSGAKNPIPVPSQIGTVAGAASYTDGFPPLTRTPLAAGGVPPSGADMNGVLYEMSAVERWLCAGGQFKYDAAFSTAIGGYPKSSVLNSTNSDIQWISTADNNTTDPDSAAAQNWITLASYGIANVTGVTGGTVTLTPAQYGKPVINLTGALTSNALVVLPANQPRVLVANNTTGAFTLTVKTAAGTGVPIVSGGMTTVYGEGTNIISPLGNTPPQFDTGKAIATMEALKQAGAQHSGPFTVAASRALTAAESIGNLIVIYGQSASINLTLPPSTGFPNGGVISFFNSGSYDVTLIRGGADAINLAGANVVSVVLKPGDSLSLSMLTGVAPAWQGFGGSALLAYIPAFAQVLVGNGYKKLPGGLILQWGTVTGAALSLTASLPIAFPTNVLSRVVSLQDKNAGLLNLPVYANSVLNNTTTVGASMNGYDTGGWTFAYIALGY